MATPKRSGVASPIKEFVYTPATDTCDNVNALVADLNQYLSILALGLPQRVSTFAQLPSGPPGALEGMEKWVSDGRKIGEYGYGTGVEAYYSNGAWRVESTDAPVKVGTTANPEVQVLGTLIGVGLNDTGGVDATNLLFSTQQAFTGLDWISPQATMADSGQLDPLGGNTASTITETSPSQTHYTAQGFQTGVVTEVSESFSIKPGLRTRATLYLYDSLITTTFVRATFDLAGGVIGVAASVGGTFTTPLATITAQGNGFYLCTLSANLVSGSGNYLAILYVDKGSGSGAENISYIGNTGSVALTIWGPKANTGVPSAYIPMNENSGLAASTVQQAFSPNGGTTSYWGTKTPNAYIGFVFDVPVPVTRIRFAPRPSSATTQVYPYAPDYAVGIAGALIQTDDSPAFDDPATIDTIPAQPGVPYYPRYWLAERAIANAQPAQYFRFLPLSSTYGGLSALQDFAKQGFTWNACPVQPVISPMGGRFPSLAPLVTITTNTADAAIYYTVGLGSLPADPTPASTLYTAPFVQTIGSGAQVFIKAIAYLPGLSTPTSPVTTSAPFNGYGYKPNDNWYDQSGNLIEAHAGSVEFDPNTNAYYWIGQLQNVNSIQRLGHPGEPNGYPGTFLYKGVSLDPKDPNGLLNWQCVGDILPQISPTYFIGGRFHWKYNALNNNYVLWHQPQNAAGASTLYVASTSGSDITTGWSWNQTPVVNNTFYDFNLFTDSDGVSVYACWRNDISTNMRIQQLNAGYTGFTGSPLSIPYVSGAREGNCLFKYPNVTGGTYFIISTTSIPYDSTIEGDMRYIYSTGATPLVNSWTALPGLYAWAVDPIGTNFNGQSGSTIIPHGCVQPLIMLDYWTATPNYNSRYVWLPLQITQQSLVVQQPATWDPSQLAIGYTLQPLSLTGATFTAGDPQGTVIGTVQGTTPSSTLALSGSHSGAVQLVAGVLQVGPSPPPSATSFSIIITETISPGANSPRSSSFILTENSIGGVLSGSVVTFATAQSITLTSLAASGLSDWAAFGYHTNGASIERKITGGSQISALSRVGVQAINNADASGNTPKFSVTWTDGTPDASIASESYVAYSGNGPELGSGMSFTVPADTNLRTLNVYVALAFNSSASGKFTATLSDASAVPYVDTSLSASSGYVVATYTITYKASAPGQHLTITWLNNTSIAQSVQIYAAVIT